MKINCHQLVVLNLDKNNFKIQKTIINILFV